MKELQKKNKSDFAAFVGEKREELRSLRFTSSGSGMRDAKSISNVKKEIARALTELNSRTEERHDA